MRFAISVPATACLFSLALCGRAALSAEAVQDKRVASLCLETCQQCLPTTYFVDASAEDAFCSSELALKSTYLCMRVYCTDAATRDAVSTLQGTCQDGVPGWEVIGNYTDADISRLRRISPEENLEEGELREVVLPSGESFTRWWRTLDSWQSASNWHYNAGLATSVFWCGIVALEMLRRLFARASSILPNVLSKRTQPFSSWFRRAVTLPALFGHHRAQRVWWCTVPQRSQALTIAAFLLLQIYLTVSGYKPFPGDLYYPSVTDQLIRQVSDRTGIISFACFPLIWLFGMRNNLLMGLTGWDFGAWSNFHRWVARAAAAHAVVHSVGYTVLVVRFGGWEYYLSWWTQMFWWTGQIATIATCFLLGFSVYWLRRYEYETFLVVHIVLSLIVLATMLGHVSIFNGQYDALFWIPVAIWICDRLLRLGRILCFNVAPWTTKAMATYDESANIVRLDVPCAASRYEPRPGTYYYLMVMNDVRCWESHPFTLASVSHASLTSKDAGEEAPLLDSNPRDDTGYARKMSFLIRPYDSFTGRLRHLAGPEPLRVLVEGPYGGTWPLHRFTNVLFLVGGSGIVVALSYLRSLLRRSPAAPLVQIHWAVREARLAESVMRHEFGDLLRCDRLEVHVYWTAAAGSAETLHMPHVRLHHRRLRVQSLVEEAAACMDKSLAIVACGPARMADESRQATVRAMATSPKHMEYFEEDFQW